MKKKSQTNTLPPMTERTFAGHVVHAAREAGWLVARTWLSKFSPAGEPDLRMIKDGRLVIAELKGEKGVVSPAQREWLDALSQVQGIEVYLWRPKDLDQIYLLLMGQEHQLEQWRRDTHDHPNP